MPLANQLPQLLLSGHKSRRTPPVKITKKDEANTLNKARDSLLLPARISRLLENSSSPTVLTTQYLLIFDEVTNRDGTSTITARPVW